MRSFGKVVKIQRIDLIMAVLLFTEEFIFQSVNNENVNIIDNQLTVNGNFVKLDVSRDKEKTYISIIIRDVMLLEYEILN